MVSVLTIQVCHCPTKAFTDKTLERVWLCTSQSLFIETDRSLGVEFGLQAMNCHPQIHGKEHWRQGQEQTEVLKAGFRLGSVIGG